MNRCTYNKLILDLLLLCTLTIFFGMLYPYGFPLFSFLLILVLGLSLQKLSAYRMSLTLIVSHIGPMLVLYLFALVLTGTIYRRIVFSLIDAVTIILLFVFLWTFLKTDRDLEYFENKFFLLLFLLGVFFALFGLVKFFLLLKGVKLSFLFSPDGKYPWGSSLKTDYNVYSRGLIFSGISGYFLLLREKRRMKKWLYFFFLLLIGSAVILSGSRSSLVYGGLLSAVALIKTFPLIYKKSIKILLRFSFSKQNIRSSIIFLIVVFILVVGVASQIKTAKYLSNLERLQNRAASIKTLFSDSGNASSFDSRFNRWNYALELYSGYSLPGKILGKGFMYLQDFGEYNETRSGLDYPHNLMLSFLLSNGAAGLAVIILYLLYILFLSCRLKHREYMFFLLLK